MTGKKKISVKLSCSDQTVLWEWGTLAAHGPSLGLTADPASTQEETDLKRAIAAYLDKIAARIKDDAINWATENMSCLEPCVNGKIDVDYPSLGEPKVELAISGGPSVRTTRITQWVRRKVFVKITLECLAG